MKKSIASLMLASCLSIATFAQFPQVDIQNVDFNYQSDRGTLTAQRIFVPELDLNLSGSFNMEREGAQVRITSDSSQDWVFDELPLFLSGFKNVKISDFDMKVGGSQAEISLKEAKMSGSHENNSGAGSLAGLKASCKEKKSGLTSMQDMIIDSCLSTAKITIDKVVFDGNDEHAGNISNVQLMTDNGEMKMRMRLTYNGSKFDILGLGYSSFDAENQKIALEIKHAVVSGVSLTDALFKLVGEIESDLIEVKKPFVYINIGNL
jgi:hypothetical protein